MSSRAYAGGYRRLDPRREHKERCHLDSSLPVAGALASPNTQQVNRSGSGTVLGIPRSRRSSRRWADRGRRCRPFCWLRSSTATLPPVGGQPSADSLADPGAAAGDERDLTGVPTLDNVCIRHRGVPFLRRCRLDQGARARRQGSRRGTRYLRYGRLLLRSLRGVSGTARGSSRTCADCKRMKPQLAQVRGNASSSVDRLASDDMLERQPFVPALPLLVAADRAAHARLPALEEIEDALHPNQARPGRCRRFPIPSSHLIGGRCARSSVWAGCRISPPLWAVPMGLAGFAGAQRAFVTLEGGPRLGRSAGT